MDALIFRSNGFLFALPSAAVAAVAQQPDLHAISFSDYFFHSYEEEHQNLILSDGYALRVSELVAVQVFAEQGSPVPRYIFESGDDWLRGLLWYEKQAVLILNPTFLIADLGRYVPELPA